MTNIEYFLFALRAGLVYKLNWYYSVMTLFSSGNQENEYAKILNNKYFVKINEEFVEITNVKISRPILIMRESITISNGDIANVSESINTTIGRVILNKLLLADNFGNKIPFINEVIKPQAIEKSIAKGMHNVDIISVEEYIKFVDASSFIQGLSRITTVSATPKNMLPPKGLKAYKQKIYSEMTAKYGKDWVNDKSKVVEYEDMLRKFDDDWLEDDPSNNILTSGKIKANARSKMFLTFGAEDGFSKSGENTNLVNNSLLDGYPEDINQLTTMFNTSRSGSYDRGNETQKGGAAAKDVLRATSSVTIEDGDCGTTVGKQIEVTKEIAESLIGRFMFTKTKNRDGKNYMPITDGNSLIGQTIEIRSPMYCLKEGNTLCATCVGEVLSNYKTGISLMVTDISGILLTTSLKSMHSVALKTMVFDPKKVIF